MKIINTSHGKIQGIELDGYSVFKGVPYAKPPIGELRWKAPQSLEAWEGVYKADKFADMPMQDLPTADLPITGRFLKEFYENAEFIPGQSEDCLYLNIWAPDQIERKKLPVAFWIHGGGFGGGYSSEMEFDGKAYCEKGVILVSVGYRVNTFGFLAHPWLNEENERNISGNYGILDQIAALKWVYKNIENFGGDPENITVFGQSAGSMSTQVLISSPLTEGMIAKAILQSGISCEENILATPSLEEEMEIGKKYVEITGAKSLEELRTMSAEQLMEAKRILDREIWKMGKGLMVVPNKDGYVLTQNVKETWNDGNMRNIPYMLGVVTDDLGATPEEIVEKRTGALMEECKRWSEKCDAVNNLPSYVYYFSHELPGDDWGAFHSAELWYMFGTYERCWRPMTKEDAILSEEMVTYWTNFMKTGNPQSTETRQWKPYTKEVNFIKQFS